MFYLSPDFQNIRKPQALKKWTKSTKISQKYDINRPTIQKQTKFDVEEGGEQQLPKRGTIDQRNETEMIRNVKHKSYHRHVRNRAYRLVSK